MSTGAAPEQQQKDSDMLADLPEYPELDSSEDELEGVNENVVDLDFDESEDLQGDADPQGSDQLFEALEKSGVLEELLADPDHFDALEEYPDMSDSEGEAEVVSSDDCEFVSEKVRVAEVEVAPDAPISVEVAPASQPVAPVEVRVAEVEVAPASQPAAPIAPAEVEVGPVEPISVEVAPATQPVAPVEVRVAEVEVAPASQPAAPIAPVSVEEPPVQTTGEHQDVPAFLKPGFLSQVLAQSDSQKPIPANLQHRRRRLPWKSTPASSVTAEKLVLSANSAPVELPVQPVSAAVLSAPGSIKRPRTSSSDIAKDGKLFKACRAVEKSIPIYRVQARKDVPGSKFMSLICIQANHSKGSEENARRFSEWCLARATSGHSKEELSAAKCTVLLSGKAALGSHTFSL